jgi:fumarate hydratase class I
MLGFIDKEGIHLEKLAEDPAALLREELGDAFVKNLKQSAGAEDIPRINLNQPMSELRAALSRLGTGSRALLSGKLLVARDAAHLKWHSLTASGKELPSYVKSYPIFYAGPAETPPGKIIGSIGPTTAQRMDPYADELMSRFASLITISKGNRSLSWAAACKKYGGFYLGAIGGAAALPAEENIISQEIIDYPELGMEAVRLIEVKNFPVFVVIDDKGEDLYANPASAI